MAATGLSNPAIAQALFVTIKTIEMHLTSTYRKLDITSRGAITAALNGDEQAPEDRRLAIAVDPSTQPPRTEPQTILRLEA
jgi:regulatory LuxR family protein